MEILSPAGDMLSLEAAIMGGCDAVYVGMKNFGARRYASNFTREEIIQAVKFCHIYGVKIYVTLNTVIKDSEVDEFLELVDYLYNLGVDAFIMQDFGMINLVLNMYPDMEVHASTQFNNSNLDTIKLLYDMGVKRVVLARELSLEEIKKIDIPIELEVFIHGALCISYSGNCLFSSMLGNRSGNRGECTGCCRLFYNLYKDDSIIKSGYLLSTKELNTSSRFDELLDTNISSFKIEGRMKSPEYVYFVTRFYRNIVDGNGYTEKDIEILKILFNRDFTLGNLFDDNISNVVSPNHLGLKIGKVIGISKDRIKIKLDKILYQEDGIRFLKSGKGMTVNFLYDKSLRLSNKADSICYVKNNIALDLMDDVYLTSSKHLSLELLNYSKRRVPINIYFEGRIGSRVKLVITDYKHSVTVYGREGEIATRQALTREDIRKKLCKLGDYVYEASDINIQMDEDLFVPISEINKLRRDAIERLNGERLKVERLGKKEVEFKKLDVLTTNYKSIVVSSEEDIRNSSSYDRFYTNNFSLFQKYMKDKDIYFIEKRNIFDSDIHSKSLIGEYRYPNNSISDYSFNVTNIYSVYYLHKLGFSAVTLSVELDSLAIDTLINNFYKKFLFYPNVEVVCTDKVELMLIKGNILGISLDGNYYIKDFKGRKFDVYFDSNFTHILNCEVTKVKDLGAKCNRRYNIKYLK